MGCEPEIRTIVWCGKGFRDFRTQGNLARYDPYGRYVSRGLPSEMCAGQHAVSASVRQGDQSLPPEAGAHAVITFSTCSSVTVRGRPGRGPGRHGNDGNDVPAHTSLRRRCDTSTPLPSRHRSQSISLTDAAALASRRRRIRSARVGPQQVRHRRPQQAAPRSAAGRSVCSCPAGHPGRAPRPAVSAGLPHRVAVPHRCSDLPRRPEGTVWRWCTGCEPYSQCVLYPSLCVTVETELMNLL